jgi:hypothetical protein
VTSHCFSPLSRDSRRYRDDVAARCTLVNQNQGMEADLWKFAENGHAASALFADRWRRRHDKTLPFGDSNVLKLVNATLL